MIQKPQQSKQKPVKLPKVGGTVTQVMAKIHAMRDAAWALSKLSEDIFEQPENLDKLVNLARAVLKHAETLQKIEMERD